LRGRRARAQAVSLSVDPWSHLALDTRYQIK